MTVPDPVESAVTGSPWDRCTKPWLMWQPAQVALSPSWIARPLAWNEFSHCWWAVTSAVFWSLWHPKQLWGDVSSSVTVTVRSQPWLRTRSMTAASAGKNLGIDISASFPASFLAYST
jgi:hypothetical protein